MEQHEDMNVRTDKDKTVIDAVYKHDRYGVREIAHAVDKEGLCIDLGAGVGAFSRLWHDLHPGAPVAAVECDQKTFAILESNIKGFATPIYATCSYVPWRPSKGYRKVSIHDVIDEATRSVAPHLVKPEDQKKKNVAIIKFDVGGFEFDILNDVTDTIMQRAQFVVGDVHGGDEGIERLREIFRKRFAYWLDLRVNQHGVFFARNPYYHFRKRCEG